ncbi:MAG TPA: pyruvate kinase [Spirochaetia bacterium]|nr:pyruvate kinase [Spirochaetia bacterium]
MKKVKILATIGPASSDLPVMIEMIKCGMDACRLNFSHGTHDQHKKVYNNISKAAQKCKKPIAVLADLQGPKIRIGRLAGGKPVILEKGRDLVLTVDNIIGSGNRLPVTYKEIIHDVKTGDRLLLDDGLLELKVKKINGHDVHCTVVIGGELGEHKGINLPGIKITTPSLSTKDKDDLLFALGLGVDYVALSFVRKPEDVTDLRKLMASYCKKIGRSEPCRIIAKIEKPEAVDCIDDILKVTDGIMVARGDLGVELSPEAVPIAQKKMIRKANRSRKLVIVATQMLESMRKNKIPTRAEVSDVANAVLDNTDAVMLSAETASGLYPLDSISMMTKIINEAEKSPFIEHHKFITDDRDNTLETAAIHAASLAAKEMKAGVIMVFTMTGNTALRLSKIRPEIPVLAFTASKSAFRAMSLYWNITPVMTGYLKSAADMIEHARRYVMKKRVYPLPLPAVFIIGELGLTHGANTVKLTVLK